MDWATLYPSCGVSTYPYSGFMGKRRESSLDLLEYLAQYYRQICRLLRNKYKWSPDIINELTIYQIQNIYKETIEDEEKEPEEEEDNWG